MLDVLKESLMITSFVFSMMLVIEYVNILTRGEWQKKLTRRLWGQYLLSAGLGAIPGCLGAFAVVAMYTHGILGVGAVVAAMIATSGDEAFVLFAMVPKQAAFITAGLFVFGIAAGYFTDTVIMKKRRAFKDQPDYRFPIHQEDFCTCLPRRNILAQQWKKCIPARGILTIVLIIIILIFAAGILGPSRWNWIRITILVVSTTALFIVSTAPDHFLDEHLWKHVVMKHVPRIFLWTAGTMFILYFLTEYLELDLEKIVQQGKWIVLFSACLIGLIPESGPHLLFVTLYAQGMVPVSILLASSIVQDGHGMLPMLAYSRPSFLKIKGINFAAGLAVGTIMMLIGF